MFSHSRNNSNHSNNNNQTKVAALKLPLLLLHTTQTKAMLRKLSNKIPKQIHNKEVSPHHFECILVHFVWLLFCLYIVQCHHRLPPIITQITTLHCTALQQCTLPSKPISQITGKCTISIFTIAMNGMGLTKLDIFWWQAKLARLQKRWQSKSTAPKTTTETTTIALLWSMQN